jgi:hypothetical protein
MKIRRGRVKGEVIYIMQYAPQFNVKTPAGIVLLLPLQGY